MRANGARSRTSWRRRSARPIETSASSRCSKPRATSHLIAALTHIDFTAGADLDLAWRQLLTALGAAPELPPPKRPARPSGVSRIPTRCRRLHRAPVRARHATRWLKRTPRIRCGPAGAWRLRKECARPGTGSRTTWTAEEVAGRRRLVGASRGGRQLRSLRRGDGAGVSLRRGPATPQPLSPREALVGLLHGAAPARHAARARCFRARVLRAFSGLEAAYQGDEAKHTITTATVCRRWPKTSSTIWRSSRSFCSKVLLTTRLTPRILRGEGRRSFVRLLGADEPFHVGFPPAVHPQDAARTVSSGRRPMPSRRGSPRPPCPPPR